MTKMSAGDPRYPRWHLELGFSIYSSFLFAWAEESRAYAWSTQGRYLYFWHPHAISLGRSDFLFFYLELFLIPALAAFLLLRLMKYFSFTRALLRALMGAVAIAGFPLVCLFCFYREHLYHEGHVLISTLAELVIAACCFILWAYHRWPVYSAGNVVLLIFHYSFWSLAFWSFFWLGPRGRPWTWEFWESWEFLKFWSYAWFAVPTLGFCNTLAWANWFRTSTAEPISVAATQT